MKLYRDFVDQASLDAEYDPAARVADVQAKMASWLERSAAAFGRLESHAKIAYGPTLAEHLDIYPAGEGAPVHVFLHGGYWRRFAARDFAWVAEPLVARGITAVVVNYALCPTVSLTEIVRQVRAAIAWCHREIHRFGGDARRLTLSGHSAGGHLVAMALATDWPVDYGLPPDLIKGAVALSGLFDLRPFPFSYLQPALQLRASEVLRLSPIDLEPVVPAPLLVAVGAAESAEFRRQSRDFAEAWRGKAAALAVEELPGADHFTVLDRLFAQDSPQLERLVAWEIAK